MSIIIPKWILFIYLLFYVHTHITQRVTDNTVEVHNIIMLRISIGITTIKFSENV